MWQADKGLIQVELGSAVVDLTAKRYQRSLFDKFMGTNNPEPAQLLIENIVALRAFLEQKENLPLPPVNVRDDGTLAADVARVYFGIEMTQFRVQRLDDILNVLLQKTRNYFSQRSSEEQLATILSASAADANDSDYAGAFQKICLAYYFSVLEGQEIEKNLAIGLGGNYSLRNSDFAHAYSYVITALNGVNSSNLFPVEMRTSLSLDAGNILRIWGDREADRNQAVHLYKAGAQHFQGAIDTARTCNDPIRLYFGLCGLAGIAYIFSELRTTESYISEARELVSDEAERKHLTEFLLHIVRQDRNRLLVENNQLKGIIRDMEVQLKRQRFVNEVGKLFIQILIAPSIYSALSGMGLMGQTIRIANCLFEGPSQIGFKNFSNMLSA